MNPSNRPNFLSGARGTRIRYKTLSWYRVIYILFRFDPQLRIEIVLSWEQIHHSWAFMVQYCSKLAPGLCRRSSSIRLRRSESNMVQFRHEFPEQTMRVNFEPNLACARATSNFLADSKSFLSCVSSVEFSDVRTKSFVITWMNFKSFRSQKTGILRVLIPVPSIQSWWFGGYNWIHS